MTVTALIFTNLEPAQQIFLQITCTEFHVCLKNLKNIVQSLIVDYRQTD
jgi:hypothetical protein